MKPYNDYTPQIAEPSSRKESSVISQDPILNARNGNKRPGANGAGKVKGGKPKKNTSAKDAASKVKQESVSLFKAQTYRDFAKNTTVRLIVGVTLGCLGVYLAAAFISYLTNCIIDQSTIEHTFIGTSGKVANTAGEGGARLSQFLINDTFGLGSVMIIFWLFAMSFKMFDTRLKFKTVNFTIKCIVALVAISLIVGLLTIGMNSPVNWGGMHGLYVNRFIIDFFGWTGAVILSVLVISIFFILCLSDFVRWILRLRKAAQQKRAEAMARRAAEEKKQRIINESKKKEMEEAAKAGEHSPLENPEEKDVNDKAVTFAADDEQFIHATEEKDVLYNAEDDGDLTPLTPPAGPAVAAAVATPAVPVAEANDGPKAPGTDPMLVRKNDIGEEDAEYPDVDPLHDGHFVWHFPPYDILNESTERVDVDGEEQLENQEKIRQTLADFKIPILKIEATVGPTVTLYEIVPDSGVKIQKIRGLVENIAMSLAATGVRIIAPIPGRGTVGIEVANKKPQTVYMRTVIKNRAFRQTHYRLPIALGSTIGGEVYMADLAKMPHLLVAGATGQGKSVGLNAIIASLLYSRRPDEVKFVMVDPKMVEFSLYAKIEKHYLAKLPEEEDPIITDVTRVAATLSSLCVEMDDRYQLLKKAGVRNIEEYNKKFNDHKLNPQNGHRFLPYIVIVVDEFGDLIMQQGKEVEMPIARLGQKARAVGMHVILATQRPSTNVITGIIKSNFPARIAFKVASGIDSKTILDTTGAQQLIGRGDMLISNNSEVTRVQCAFINTPEVEKLCDYIAQQPAAQGAYILPEPRVGENSEMPGGSHGSITERDPLFEEVARMVVASNSASTSALQRRYSIGYNRAGKIMDQLEALGIVGPATGGKPRAVLMESGPLEDLLSTL